MKTGVRNIEEEKDDSHYHVRMTWEGEDIERIRRHSNGVRGNEDHSGIREKNEEENKEDEGGERRAGEGVWGIRIGQGGSEKIVKSMVM